MLNKLIPIFALCLFATVGCQDTDSTKQKVIDNYMLQFSNADVRKFDISRCQTDCSLDSGKITSVYLDNDLLTIELEHWMNCIGATHCSFDFNKETLRLNLRRKPEGYDVSEKGDTLFIYSAAACNCNFKMSFELAGFAEIPQEILINGSEVENFLGFMELDD